MRIRVPAGAHHLPQQNAPRVRGLPSPHPIQATIVGRTVGAHEEMMETRKFRNYVGGDAIAEIALGWVVAQIGEREDRDRRLLIKLSIAIL